MTSNGVLGGIGRIIEFVLIYNNWDAHSPVKSNLDYLEDLGVYLVEQDAQVLNTFSTEQAQILDRLRHVRQKCDFLSCGAYDQLRKLAHIAHDPL